MQVLADYLQNSDYDKGVLNFLIGDLLNDLNSITLAQGSLLIVQTYSLLDKMSFRLLREFLKKFMLVELQDHLDQDLLLISPKDLVPIKMVHTG